MAYYLESFDLDMKNNILKPSLLPEYKDKIFIVMIMADWCGHCKKVKPEYLKAIKDLESKGVICCFADTTGETGEEKELSKMTKFFKEFQGFPTFKMFKNGKEIKTHTGPRDAKSFVEFAQN